MKELKPVARDGLTELRFGTTLFAIFSLVFWYRFAFLAHESSLIWLQSSLAAVILGFMGMWILKRRKQKSS
jgi:hypothetical protein